MLIFRPEIDHRVHPNLQGILKACCMLLWFALPISPAALLAQGPHSIESPPAIVKTTTEPVPDTPASTFDSDSSGNPIIKVARTIGEDEIHILKAPFQKKAIPWDVFLVGATTALAATDADERVLQDVPVSWHQTNRDISNAFTFGTAAVAGGIYLTGLVTKNAHEQEVGIRTAESTVDSVILYAAMKAIFQRQRPYTGPGEGKFFAGNWSNGSFPSGHAMFSWTIASTVAHQYHSIPLDLLLYGMAGTVSVTRVTAGQHFPSDVIVGSVLGYLIGDYVAHKPSTGFLIRQNKFARVRDAVLQHINVGVE
jgi:membrane-associated phospholipid phosphatase